MALFLPPLALAAPAATVAASFKPAFSFANLFTGITAGAGIFEAISALAEGKAIEGAAQFNADMARQNAELSKAKRAVIGRRKRKRLKSFVSTQKALFAKAGVTLSGSPLRVIEETLAEGELDIIIGNINASIEQSRFESQAREDELTALRARTAGKVRAGLTLLETGGKIAERLIK